MADSLYKQSLDAVVSTLQGLSLSRIENSEIVARKLPWDNTMLHRGITVSWDDEQADGPGPAESTNNRDMVGYPCHITIVEGTGRVWADEIGTISTRRQAIRRAFHNERLSMTGETGSNHVLCKVTHGGPSIPKEYIKNVDVSQMTVWVWWLEKRT